MNMFWPGLLSGLLIVFLIAVHRGMKKARKDREALDAEAAAGWERKAAEVNQRYDRAGTRVRLGQL